MHLNRYAMLWLTIWPWEIAPVKHDMRLWSMDRVVHPTTRLLHTNSSPFGL